ncbi:MarR family transcriptional regulator [Streptomyces sp. URMC 127]|uniref:MarR family transcriptional regulator n=1 Tax=Streptomyces sp. URMC 127 TaxID=3423402 RepID=UPI003F1C045C
MAAANSSALLPAPSHPMANPGFGKHSAPDQAPPGAHDFVHLPKREASIAAFIDRLPEGAAMDVKTLAKVLPDYGQQACRTAIRHLREAGHVFLRQATAMTKAGQRWVTLTFFSRTARSQAWWEEQVGKGSKSRTETRPEASPEPEPEAAPEQEAAPEPDAEPEREATPEPITEPDFAPEPAPEPAPAPALEPAPAPAPAPAEAAPAEAAPAPAPAPEPTSTPVRTEPRPLPSRAYQALARLRYADPRLTLSAAECEALEPLAAQWLTYDATPEQLTAAVTAGLPPQIHSPAGFVRNRLEKKMPPVPLRFLAAYNDHSVRRDIVKWGVEACVSCGDVDVSTTLGEGLCKACAEIPDVPDTFLAATAFEDEPSKWEAVPPEEVTRWVDICRVAARNARRSRA